MGQFRKGAIRANDNEHCKDWSLDYTATDPELDRLERYAADMNRRDPMRRQWFVAKTTDAATGEIKRFVDCQG
jgi:hypothetical protein